MKNSGHKYKTNIVHRNKAKGKTQWHKDISEDLERVLWEFGFEKEWGDFEKIFSLKISNKIPGVLDSEEYLNIACYVCSQQEWHGWPGNVKRSEKDLPPYRVLLKWVEHEYTSRAKIKKLQRFQASSI